MSDGPIVQVEGDQIIYRASAVGGCQKALLAARLGYDQTPTPEKMQKVFQAGHEAEVLARAKIALMEHGMLYFAQIEVCYQVTENVAVVGHVDGLHMPPAELPLDVDERRAFRGPSDAVYIGEIKSQSAEAWAQRRAGVRSRLMDRYDWQTSVYSHALGLPVIMWWFNRETGEIEPQIVKRPRISEKKLRDRVLAIEKAAETGVLSLSCDQTMYPCPVFYLHDEDDERRRVVDWGDVEPEDVNEQVIELLANSYKRNQKEEKLAGERKETAKKALRSQFKGKTISTDGGWRVTFFEGRRTVEIRQVVEDDPWRQEITWEQIRVTEPKK